MSVYINDGVVIFSGDKVAISNACCCGGACCFECDPCEFRSQSDCETAGGTYRGDGTTCDVDPPPCSAPTGACCVAEGCSIQIEADCIGLGGTWQGCPTTCDPNPCGGSPPTGACCVGETCSITTDAACTGLYHGDGTTCDPNPCCNPPCDCGFNEFYPFESDCPKKYLTSTEHLTFNETRTAPFEDCDSHWDRTVISTIDPLTCLTTVTCFGSGSITGTEPHEWTWEPDGVGGCHAVGGIPGDPVACATVCSSPTGGGGVSATEKIETCEYHITGYDASLNITTTLSDVCIPPMI